MRRPEVHGVVLAGEAGVGKTRLARESLRLAGSAGLHTEWAVGTHSSASIPFGAVAHLLPEDLSPRGSAPGGTRNLLRTAGTALAARADGGRLVLGVDDAHLLDDFSSALVLHLATEGLAFVVEAVRTGEPAADAVVSLWKEGLADRIEVQPLSRTETEELVELVLGGQVDGATLHHLWTRTRGNPLFLRELVLGGLDRGFLVEGDGVWRWQGPIVAGPRLIEVIEARLGHLEAEDRAALEIVAAADILGIEAMVEMASLAAIEAAERRGLLEESVEGRRQQVRLAHPLYAEVLRARTPPVRAREIRRHLADALEATGLRRAGDLLRLATWRLEGGGPARPGILAAAASRALEASDLSLAERLARGALGAGGGSDASHLLAEALVAEGRYEEAETTLRRLQDEVETGPRVARTVNARAWNLFWHMGMPEAALELTERVESPADPDLRGQLRAARATLLAFTGRNQEAIDLVAGLLEGPPPSPGALRWLGPVMWGLNLAGRSDLVAAAIDHLAEGEERKRRETAASHVWRIWLRNNRAAADLLSGRLEAAAVGADRLYREVLERGDPWFRGSLAWGLGLIARTQGRVRTAIRWLREAVSIWREVDMLRQLPDCLGDLAYAEALLGNVGAAEAALEEGERLRVPSARRGELHLRLGELHLRLGRAWTAVARGEISTGASLALEAAEVTGAMGQYAYQAIALHEAARLGEARTVAGPLADLAQRVDGRMSDTYALQARAAAAHDALLLEEASGEFEEMGSMLYAAEAAAEASRIHREEGRIGSALAASARAARLARHCQGARTPALHAVELLIPLTRREREVATLAASGLANRDIAERLVVSLRTVENHLHAAYAKLGVTGRKDLGAILAPERSGGPPPKT